MKRSLNWKENEKCSQLSLPILRWNSQEGIPPIHLGSYAKGWYVAQGLMAKCLIVCNNKENIEQALCVLISKLWFRSQVRWQIFNYLF